MKWIPTEWRKPTAEELAEHPGLMLISDSNFPEDGETVILTNGKDVWVDVNEYDDGYYLENSDWTDVTAWMPLPEPYKGGAK